MVDIIVAMMDCGGCLLLRLCILQLFFLLFPRCLVKGSRFTLGVWGWRCARGVRNRNRPRAKVVGLKKVWQVWQARHFVTFHVFQEESVCAQPSWQ